MNIAVTAGVRSREGMYIDKLWLPEIPSIALKP